MLVEVCANSVESARAAQDAGADRVEFCSELAVGGITPSRGLLEEVRQAVSIPVHVLIRPRSGDFTYSHAEFRAMLSDIRHCVGMGFEGIVSGCLQPDGRVDVARTRELLGATGNARFTFHRAFDRSTDPHAALEALEELGVQTILSSGQALSAPEGLPLLESLQQRARRIRMMPGGGIHPGNIRLFAGKGFEAVHLSGIRKGPARETYPGPPMNAPGLLRETKPLVSDPEVVKAVVDSLKAIADGG
ncbi:MULTISPECIES: copper homeostasis protein CutC [Robiginitalea]|uniref:PF03932 family protein CutC n=1 Tax=Robiginitalea biformata (strain ATCC BAA-864 / DSM 15991 / KCTC 12146 / HTCC2501) TaxID=313596 RepID=A4CGC5_ROBBH|nr:MULTISPECIES: copper homeostasis protein CutC [Robiginitalea]EAR15983.1 probable copper homeostasis protein [Robiginitalea biformata HTCC2501]MDC6354409.1 copper homeostasis protein CutC [Robiginitalea sp. PM2]MDC6374909.1 copper homeostasis protein CutC [Robiginitalea sp. SP8]